MAEVVVQKIFGAPSEIVVERCGRFDTIADWHPAFDAGRIEGEGAERVRALSMGGGSVREQLVDEGEHGYSYRVLAHPLPIRDAIGQVVVRDQEGGGSQLSWWVEFAPSGPVPEQVLTAALDGMLRMGVEAVAIALASGDEAQASAEDSWTDVTAPESVSPNDAGADLSAPDDAALDEWGDVTIPSNTEPR